MIEKEFVPYQESFELIKQLGFDESCFGYYGEINGGEIELFLKKDFDSPALQDLIKDSVQMDLVYVLAPTYHQAFRWFREKHGLFSEIQPYLIIGTQWRYTITNRNNSSGLPHKEGFQTYEEAELACLRKLIEIVKNKI